MAGRLKTRPHPSTGRSDEPPNIKNKKKRKKKKKKKKTTDDRRTRVLPWSTRHLRRLEIGPPSMFFVFFLQQTELPTWTRTNGPVVSRSRLAAAVCRMRATLLPAIRLYHSADKGASGTRKEMTSLRRRTLTSFRQQWRSILPRTALLIKKSHPRWFDSMKSTHTHTHPRTGG